MDYQHLLRIGLVPAAGAAAEGEPPTADSESEDGDEDLVTLDLGTGEPAVTFPRALANAFLRAELTLTGFATAAFAATVSVLAEDGRPGAALQAWGLSPQSAHRLLGLVRSCDDLAAGAVPPGDALLALCQLLAQHRHEPPPGCRSADEAACAWFDLLLDGHQPRPAAFAALATVRRPLPSVYCLQFSSRLVLASVFVRAQEYYECPGDSIRRQEFSLEEYKAWYRETEDRGFDYYARWDGFNLPSWVLRDVRQGKLGPLRPQEEALLALVEGAEEPFYVIGVCEGNDALRHELAHALFATNEGYREAVKEALWGLDAEVREAMWRQLLSMGYCADRDIMEDEMQAYMAQGDSGLGGAGAAAVAEQVQRLFDRFAERRA